MRTLRNPIQRCSGYLQVDLKDRASQDGAAGRNFSAPSADIADRPGGQPLHTSDPPVPFNVR